MLCAGAPRLTEVDAAPSDTITAAGLRPIPKHCDSVGLLYRDADSDWPDEAAGRRLDDRPRVA